MLIWSEENHLNHANAAREDGIKISQKGIVMAEEMKNMNPNESENTTDKQPTIEELTLQLAKANAEKARYKNSIDKLTHENSELSKWKRERMTAQEQQEAEDAEAQAIRDAYVKELEDYKAINEAAKRYASMGMGVELATATATAEIRGDMDTVLANINKNKEDALQAAKAEWLKSRPDIPDGNSNSGITQEEFDNMDMFERTKLLRSDPETYNRLLGKK